MISLCEPYWERADALRVQLESFVKFYGGRDDIEVVIVDDGSPTEPAAPVVEEFRGKLDIRLFEEPMRLPGDGKDPCVPMNRAVREARGDLVVLTQADIEHLSDVVGGLKFIYDQVGVEDAVVYPFVVDRPNPGDGVRFNLWRCVSFTPFPTTDSTLISKKFYERVGGFCEDFRDGYAHSDSDFMRTLSKHGARFFSVPNLTVMHRGDLCRQWRDPVDGAERQRKTLQSSIRMVRRQGSHDRFVTCPMPVYTEHGVAPVVVAGVLPKLEDLEDEWRRRFGDDPLP